MENISKIISIEHPTHDVLRIKIEKTDKIQFVPGQAADISINKAGWENELRAFTFTSLPHENYLEFTIKTYPSHQGVTNQLLSVKEGDELIVGGVFGDIHYKGEGIFLAGGAGITPFIAIFKQLQKENKLGQNKLIFANKLKADIIDEVWFRSILGNKFINVLSGEKAEGYEYGYLTADIIRKHQNSNLKYYYLCGPPPMMDAVEKALDNLGINKEYIVKEPF